jgi:hypothetical protein
LETSSSIPRPDGRKLSYQHTVCILQIMCKFEHASAIQPRTSNLWMPEDSTVLALYNHLRHEFSHREFDNNLSFITIISLGSHNMAVGQDCTSNVGTATHNIIGLGIKTLTTFPIDSSDSIQTSFISFRQQFR